jgi:hypothetical protein
MTTILFRMGSVNFDIPGLLKGMYDELADSLAGAATRHINEELDRVVEEGLGRGWHDRREKIKGRGLFECQRCGSRWRKQFTRNGYRKRELSLVIGRLQINLPRVVCSCGGSVRLNLAGLRPWQRLGEDVKALVQHWSALAYSLRQMKNEIDEAWQTSVGLQTLNRRFHALVKDTPVWQTEWLKEVPPVVMMDAVWVTVMCPTQKVKKDKLGRRRRVKKRMKLPIMIALGIWPEEERHKVLDWEVADGPGEDKESWLRLINRLEQRGLHPHFGLQLFITDGDQGLINALEEVFWDVPRQRCVFHKIRNVSRDLIIPEALSEKERRAYRRDFLQQLARIWQAPTRKEARKRYNHFCRQWTSAQPKAVATLQRDFQDTLTFYTLQHRNRLWHPRFLRTTSLLERLNRHVRARMHKAGAFHSIAGLQAMLIQVLLHP